MLYEIIDNEKTGFLENWEAQTKKAWLGIINELRYCADEYQFKSFKEACQELNLEAVKVKP